MRVWLSWALVPWILLSITQPPNLLGILILVVGTILRTWASGHLDKEGSLATSGPYRFSRNPLYVGSILIAVAIPMSQENWLLTVAIGLISLFIHLPIIGAEERVLKEKFGDAFANYCRQVPRLFSVVLFLKSLALRRDGFNWAFFRRNRGWEPIAVATALMATSVAVYYSRVAISEPVQLLTTLNSILLNS